MMSNLENLVKSLISKPFAPQDRTDIIIGTCETMCPGEEEKMRCREGLINDLEISQSMHPCLVKSYSRSAAATNLAKPHLLRPFPVLMTTLDHLLFYICNKSDVDLPVIYDFVQDRLRAIRQDMTIQRFSIYQCKQLLEPMIRFYVFCGYRLCESPQRNFDPVLNKQFLLECQKQYLKCCDTIDNNRDIVDDMQELHVKSKFKFSYDRPLMEALYILCNLNDAHPLYRFFNLPKRIKEHGTVKLAYKISVENLLGNYVRVTSLALRLCPLGYCAFSINLPCIQRKALQVMSHAYSSKQQHVPCGLVQHMLWFTCPDHLVEVATHYGIHLEYEKIYFWKADFKTDVALHKPKLMYLLDTNHDLSWDNIFQYKSS